MRPTDRLAASGIPYSRNKDQITIRRACITIDYWPRRGEWVERGSGRRRLGIRTLMQRLEAAS